MAPRLWIESLHDGGPAGPEILPRVRVQEEGEDRLSLQGDCSASLDLRAGRGCVEGGDGLAGVDSLVRLSLSLLAPAEGWILFHGAAIELASRKWALLVGESGAGKSTAAHAFASFCDELVLARGSSDAAEAASTPYWNGTPGSASIAAIVCLERSEAPGSRLLRGGEAIRALLPHLVRYVRREAADGALFQRLLELVQGVPILRARFVTGHSYVARLGSELERLGFGPRRRILNPAALAGPGPVVQRGGCL